MIHTSTTCGSNAKSRQDCNLKARQRKLYADVSETLRFIHSQKGIVDCVCHSACTWRHAFVFPIKQFCAVFSGKLSFYKSLPKGGTCQKEHQRRCLLRVIASPLGTRYLRCEPLISEPHLRRALGGINDRTMPVP